MRVVILEVEVLQKFVHKKSRVYQYDAVLYFVDNDVLMILIGEYSDN